MSDGGEEMSITKNLQFPWFYPSDPPQGIAKSWSFEAKFQEFCISALTEVSQKNNAIISIPNLRELSGSQGGCEVATLYQKIVKPNSNAHSDRTKCHCILRNVIRQPRTSSISHWHLHEILSCRFFSSTSNRNTSRLPESAALIASGILNLLAA